MTKDIKAAAFLLQQGELVAFPTETVYGLGADAASDAAVAKVFRVKGRPSFNPLIVHVASLEAARVLADFTPEALALAQAFWPGPLTLVLKKRSDAQISCLATAGLSSVALRVPRHLVALDLLKAFGKPIVAPSANPSGYLSPTQSLHVFSHLGSHVSCILEGGDCVFGLESTVVSCLSTYPELLRPGSISFEEITSQLMDCGLQQGGEPLSRHVTHSVQNPDFPKSPGLLLRHYAPLGRLRLNVTSMEEGEVLLAFGVPSFPVCGPVFWLSEQADLTEAAGKLFRLLHLCDQKSFSKIAVMPIPERGVGLAINDRLRRGSEQ